VKVKILSLPVSKTGSLTLNFTFMVTTGMVSPKLSGRSIRLRMVPSRTLRISLSGLHSATVATTPLAAIWTSVCIRSLSRLLLQLEWKSGQ
jgi:hypothetical protein